MRQRSLLFLLCGLLFAGCGSGGSSGGRSGGAAGQTSARALHNGLPARRVAPLRPPLRPVARSVRVPILTYHRVHEFATEYTKSIPDLTIEPSVFAAEIQALARSGHHSISQRQLFEALFRGAPLPRKPVLITVDDGYVDDVDQILPVLRRNHMVATFYIITSRLHEPGFLNPNQVRKLDAAGMDIGAHTRTHVPLASLPPAQAQSEIAGSRRDLQAIVGHPVDFFAYPYGSFSASVVQLVRGAGFVLAVTTNGGTTESSLAPLTMPRVHVGRSMTVSSLLACVSGRCG